MFPETRPVGLELPSEYKGSYYFYISKSFFIILRFFFKKS